MYCLVCQLVCLSRYSERKLVNESKQVGLSLRQFEVWRSTAATMQPLQYCKTKSERVKKKSYPERRRVLRLKTWVQVLHNPLPPIPVDLFTFGSQTQGRKENISRLCVWVLPLKDLPFYSQFMILWFKLVAVSNQILQKLQEHLSWWACAWLFTFSLSHCSVMKPEGSAGICPRSWSTFEESWVSQVKSITRWLCLKLLSEK